MVTLSALNVVWPEGGTMNPFPPPGGPMSSPIPADSAAARFRLPVEPPTRDLLVASLASIAGACQLFAWALARLPIFILVLGLVLIGIAVGFALAALIRHLRLRWIAYIGPMSLTVVNGSRRRVLRWEEVGAVRYDDFRLRVLGTDGRPSAILPVDRTRAAHEAARDLAAAMRAQLVTRRS
jgi:hypothetical protein